MSGDGIEAEWEERARVVFPAGGFGNFDPSITVSRGQGARVWDETGKHYVDFLIGSGPLVLGHLNPEVVEAVQQQLEKGTTYFANNAKAIELAEEICQAVACAEQVRYVSTGTEAVMYAIRLARAHTRRDKILKFEGGFHGMSSEGLMSLAPTRLENFPLAVPDSAGIPDNVRDNVLVAPFNDSAAATQLIGEYGDDIAAVIVEPLQRLLLPEPDFLETLRVMTQERGIILIFDEIVTGFRLAYGGAQERYGVTPDLCTLGKIVGGGFPLAVVAGKTELMAHFDKNLSTDTGFTFQNGTLSGNPIAAAAGLKTLEILRRPGSYQRLRANGEQVMKAITEHLGFQQISHRIVGDPVMFDIVFTESSVKNYRDVLKGDEERSRRFNACLREHNVLKLDTKFYISLALTEEDLDLTGLSIREAAQKLALA